MDIKLNHHLDHFPGKVLDEMVRLHFIEGLSYAEISRRAGVSKSRGWSAMRSHEAQWRLKYDEEVKALNRRYIRQQQEEK